MKPSEWLSIVIIDQNAAIASLISHNHTIGFDDLPHDGANDHEAFALFIGGDDFGIFYNRLCFGNIEGSRIGKRIRKAGLNRVPDDFAKGGLYQRRELLSDLRCKAAGLDRCNDHSNEFFGGRIQQGHNLFFY